MSLTKFLDSKNDFAFKRIFGTEKNKDILIHFINDMLCFVGDKKITSETTEADLKKIIGHDPIIERAYEALNRFSFSKDELFLYEAEEKRVRDESAVLEQKLDDAKAKGKAEGIAEEKTKIAKTMLQGGLSVEQVSKMTGLSIAEVKKLL